MPRLRLRDLLVTLALVGATVTTAAADGVYVTESFGGIDVKDQLGESMDGAVKIKLAFGMRRGRWAVEGWMAGGLGFGDHHDGAKPLPPSCVGKRCGVPVPDAPDHAHGASVGSALFMYGLDLKYLAPLSPHVELYVRGSMSRGVLDNDYAGNGLGVGAGIQIKGKVPAVGFLFWPLFFTNWGPKVTAALFVDNGVDFYRLHHGGDRSSGRSIDAQLHHLTFGFGVGSDF